MSLWYLKGIDNLFLYNPVRIRIFNTLHAWCTPVDCREQQDISANGKTVTHVGDEAGFHRKKKARSQ